jgi:hypothetical protein
MNQRTYTEVCLPNVQELLKREELYLQEDNDSAHTGTIATAYKRKYGIHSFWTPSISPDLSCAEAFARSLKDAFHTRGHYSKEEATSYIIDCIYLIPQEHI